MEFNQQQNPGNPGERMNIAHEVKQFYANDFKALFMAFFANPFEGILSIFKNPSEKSFIHSIILYISVFLLYFLGTYLLAGEMREYMSFGSFLNIGLVPVLIMLCLSGLSFAIKAVSGKANFKSELLTGALCGIPLGLIVPLSLIAKIFGSSADVMMLIQNPLGAGMFMGLVVLYLLLMMINVFNQSIKSGGAKDLFAWYLAPLAVLLSFYLSFNISTNLF